MRRLKRHEEPLLADEGVVRARGGEQIRLRGRLGLEAVEELVHIAHGLVGGLVGRGARVVVAPELLVRPDEIGPQDAAAFVRLRPVLAHFEIELERTRRKRLQLRLLGAVDAVGRPDEEAVDQHEQERQLPDDAADHVAGLVHRVVLGEDALEREPDEAARGDHADDNERDGERLIQLSLTSPRFRGLGVACYRAGVKRRRHRERSVEIQRFRFDCLGSPEGQAARRYFVSEAAESLDRHASLAMTAPYARGRDDDTTKDRSHLPCPAGNSARSASSVSASATGLSCRQRSILGNRTAIPLRCRLLGAMPSKPSSNTCVGLTLRTGPNVSTVVRRMIASISRISASLRPE